MQMSAKSIPAPFRITLFWIDDIDQERRALLDGLKLPGNKLIDCRLAIAILGCDQVGYGVASHHDGAVQDGGKVGIAFIARGFVLSADLEYGLECGFDLVAARVE